MKRLALVLIALVALVGVAPAHAQEQTSSERINAFAFDAVVNDDGSLGVTETIDYDFGSEQHHGIFRDIPTRLTYDDRFTIVMLSSAGHRLSGIRFDDLQFETGYDKWQAYGQSKTANSLFAVHH